MPDTRTREPTSAGDAEVLGAGPEGRLASVIVRSTGRSTLTEALGSVAFQAYPVVEVVVVDALGGDHPGVPERCGPFPLRVVGTGEPLPRSRAANAGLDAARGEYVAFLDDDDWFLPEHLDVLVGALRATPGARVAYGGVEGVDAAGVVVHMLSMPFSYPRLCVGNYIPINAAVFERSLVDEGCRFDEDLDVYEDWDFWLQLARRGRVVHVDHVTARYRAGGGSRVGLSADPMVQQQARDRVWEKWSRLWSDREAREALAWLEGELAERDRVIDDLTARLRDVEGRLSEALASPGWRLMAPARSLAALLRRS